LLAEEGSFPEAGADDGVGADAGAFRREA